MTGKSSGIGGNDQKLLTGAPVLLALPPAREATAEEEQQPVDREQVRIQLKDTQIGDDVKAEGSVQQTRQTGASHAVRLMSKTELESLVAEYSARPEALDEADRYKSSRLLSLGKKPHPAAVSMMIAESNILHKKEGHTENVRSFLELIFDQSQTLRRNVDKNDVLAASQWLNLADLKLPARVLAGGKLSDEDFAKWIKPRAKVSAELFVDLKLGRDQVADLIAEHKQGKTLGGQMLDLADMISGMASKPFFRKDGKVDGAKILEKIDANRYDADVFAAFKRALTDGTIDTAIENARADDLYLR